MPASRPGRGDWSDLATFADVTACYRLLLERLPDAEGFAHYDRRLSSDNVSVHELVEEFLGSVEFARAHALGRPGDRGRTRWSDTCEGFRIHVDPTDYAVGHTLARTGSYEPDVSATLRSVLGQGATFVDIGANIGWFSLLGASLVGAAGRVVAIEPNPPQRCPAAPERQGQRVRQHRGDSGRPVRAPGRRGLETDGSNGRIIPVDGPPATPVEAEFVVASYPLDDVLASADIGRADVVKMDVEGAEPLVLQGARATFSTGPPVLISEFFPLALDSSPWGSAQSYLSTLRAFGYRLSVIGHEGEGDCDDSKKSSPWRPLRAETTWTF